MDKKIACSNLNAAACYRGNFGDRRLRECFCGSAFQAIGHLEPGCNIFGFTKGQFSLMDLITAVLSQTGPARVDLSTWTAASADLEHCYQFLQSGKVHSTRWVVDRSFPDRQPEYFKSLLSKFGGDSVRLTRTHAKFCLVRNDSWDICIRSSMNLNKNPRFENFEITDNAGFADYFESIVDEIFDRPDVGEIPSYPDTDREFRAVEVMGESYGDADFALDSVDFGI